MDAGIFFIIVALFCINGSIKKLTKEIKELNRNRGESSK